jgi:hypothetical protein
MKRFVNTFLLIFITIFLIACSTVKDGFESQRKNSTEEFLVEKKKPLVMPPDYNELPQPKNENNEVNLEENDIKKLIIGKEKNNVNPDNQKESNKTFEESFLKKIKN